MHVHSKYQIDKAAGNDPEEPQTQAVHFHAKHKTLRASNGKILATVPVERVAKGECNAQLSPKSFKLARSEQKERDEQLLEIPVSKHDAKVGGGIQIKLLGTQDEMNLDAVPKMRQGTNGTHTVAIDVAHLDQLAKAIGAKEGKTKIVRLVLRLKDASSAIVVLPQFGDQAVGVLMPVGMADEGNA